MIAIVACLLAVQADETFKTEDGVAIAATYFGPKSPKKGMAAAVLVPMYLSNRAAWKGFAEKAAKRDVACLAIDPRGHGGSGNPTGKKPEEWGAEWLEVVKDLKAARAQLVAKGFDAKRIAVVGASIGGSLALEHAVADETVAGLAVLSLSTNLTGKSPEENIARYGKRPLFVAYSADDREWAETGRATAKAASGAKTVKEYARAGHGTEMFGREDKPGDLTESLVAWILALGK